MQPPEYFTKGITTAHQRISPWIRRTPVFELAPGAFGLANRITLKLENHQYTGSFKVRGAYNRLLQYRQARHVVAASGGNHGAAVAFAARSLGQTSEIFAPTISNPIKRQRLADYGADVRIVGDVFVESLAASEARIKETGALGVHAFDHEDAVFGQGTIGLEIEEQIGTPDVVLVAVGGGGFAAGVASWFQHRSRVIGIEPERAPTLYDALQAGHPVDVSTGGVAADALGCRRIGDVTFPILKQYISEAALVDEDSIMAARREFWNELRMLVEPAAALPLAALKTGKVSIPRSAHVCIIVCGANTELSVE